MSFEFRDAKRENAPLLILLAGGTGSGKTESAMRLATGLSNGKPFAVIDSENGRALHKADDYTFKHAALTEPFTPERYTEAVTDADSAGFPVIIIDSGSHEYEGIGGVLEMQTEEFKRLGEREGARMSSWIEPKRRHKRFVQQLLRTRAHVIMCLRAEDKIEILKIDGKTVVRPKESLTGAEGWIPICERRLPFEATISLLLTADAPGVPKPIKLESRHQEFVPLTEPLTEETGRKLALWAAGSAGEPTAVDGVPAPPVPQATSSTGDPASPADQMPSDALPSSPASEGTPRYISDKQRERLFTIATKSGVPEETVREIVIGETGQASTKEIPAGQVYDTIITAIQAKATA